MNDALGRLAVALSDRYTIEHEIGAGGMATVYLAHDVKHDRKVAIKVLRPELATVLGAERFLSEVKVTANLQHPHILPLHDSGEADGFLFYVMPFVEGHSLRDKLTAEGGLPISEATRILRDVVDALTHAHSHGVVHRDIKPDNVMLSGRHALVTDFGIAKALSEATGRDKLTTAGIALGTPAYMAPEQASADPHVDHRADIYAVGALAYEVLTGRPPFLGTTAQMVLAAHVSETPAPVTKYRESVSPELNDVIMRCLEKKAADRWQRADDLLLQLEALTTPSGGVTPTDTVPIRVHRGGRFRRTAAAIGVAVVMAAVVGAWFMTREPPVTVVVRTAQLTRAPGLELDPAISPDGRWVAYAAGPIDSTHIHLQQVSGGRAIDLTDGLPGRHRWPKWSPDNDRILFQAGDAIYVVPALGGSPRLVVNRGSSPAWSPDGREIVFESDSGIYVQPIDGGAAQLLGNDEDPHSFQWSRDGTRIAYVSGNSGYVFGTRALGAIYQSTLRTLQLDSREATTTSGDQYLHLSPVWLPSDRQLLYVSDAGGTRDVYQVRVTSSGAPVGKPRRVTTGLDVLTFSVSADATAMAYSVFRTESNIFSIAIPTDGPVSVVEAVPITSGNQYIEGISVSPDGRWLTYDSNLRGNQDIYRVEIAGGEPEQLTIDPRHDYIPSWSPDGSEIAFYSFRHGSRDIFVMNADGRSERRLTDYPGQERYPDWSPDGNSLVFMADRTGRAELYVITRDHPDTEWSDPRQITFDGGAEPRWSPDGRWIAYIFGRALRIVSPEGGESRVLVAPDATPGRAAPDFPEWSADGQTAFYWARTITTEPSIWGVPVSGGAPELFVRFDDPTRLPNRDEFTTDGTRFYFTLGRRESDIWVGELTGKE